MRLIGKERLSPVLGIDNYIDVWVSAWVAELSNGNWKGSQDFMFAYPRVEQVNTCFFIFPVSDTCQRIKLCMSFERGTALIVEVFSHE